jgi:hypothetical protein
MLVGALVGGLPWLGLLGVWNFSASGVLQVAAVYGAGGAVAGLILGGLLVFFFKSKDRWDRFSA